MEIPEQYICCICSQVLNNPLKHSCNTSMCSQCIQQFVSSSQNPLCPICRESISIQQFTNNEEMLNNMRQIQVDCYCNQQIPLLQVNTHLERCSQYSQFIQKTAQENKREGTGTVNRSTFKCPFCSEDNMRRDTLLQHVNQRHQNQPGICPICAVQQYGDPNYVSQNLSGHLQMRHKYDLDTYTAYEMDDDAILQQVLQASLNDN